ncbi:MAG: hypothetical protein ACTH0S_03180 [Senegalia sp. (in: firmicutes)]
MKVLSTISPSSFNLISKISFFSEEKLLLPFSPEPNIWILLSSTYVSISESKFSILYSLKS